MRSTLISTICIALLGLCAFLGAEPGEETVQVRLRLVDAETGKDIAGIVRVFAKADDKPLSLSGLFDRLRGIEKVESGAAGWHVVPASGATTTLPRAVLRLEALSGLETAVAKQELDLTKKPAEEIAIKLAFIFRPEKHGLVAGNTHLHLKGMTQQDASAYLKQIPAADGLKVLFISYLERAKDDVTYITNRYPAGALKEFDAGGVLVSNGEEYRHNFTPFGQGYGHVMFLNIKEHIKPASLGAGITGAGTDDSPLGPGIAAARKQGGTIVWCHNTSGHEGIVRMLAGQLDALNVFDGSRGGTFEDKYYRYLNIGLRLPISTGTDWFMYDFSRVYAKIPGQLTLPAWLDAVKAGRNSISNGPLLTLTVDGKEPGDVIALDKPRSVRIEATATGRHSFGEVQLVRNGSVIKKQTVEMKEGVATAKLVHEVRMDESAWFAVRVESPTTNELGQKLFAHTSPVYVDLAGQRVFDPEAARGLQRYLEEAKADIRAKGKFSNAAAGEKLEALYDAAIADLVKRKP